MMMRNFLSLIILSILMFPSITLAATTKNPSATSTQTADQVWIAYVDKENSVYIIHPDGSEKKKISEELAVLSDIRWSSSGRYLSFISGTTPFSFVTGPYTLWVWDSEIQQLQSMVIGSANMPLNYAWSPSEDVFAILDVRGEQDSSYLDNYFYSLRLVNLATNEQRIILDQTKYSFYWLPEGKRIAYEPFWEIPDSICVDNYHVYTTYGGINTVDIQTGEIAPLVAPKNSPLSIIDISPHGSSIVFQEYPSRCEAFDGPGCAYPFSFVRIASPESWELMPNAYCEWSPSERKIACNGGGCGMSGDPVSIYDNNYQLIKEIPQVSSQLTDPPPNGNLLWSPNEALLAIEIREDTPPFRNATLIVDTRSWNTLADLQGAGFGWSPDGNYLLLNNQADSDDGVLGIFDVNSQEFQSLGASSVQMAVWQPGEPTTVSAEAWQSWKARKIESIDALQNVGVDMGFDQKVYGLVPFPDETGVTDLLDQLPDDPADLSPQQVEAFYRMLLEEEALAKIQDSYEVSSNDLGNWMSNLVKFFLFTGQMFAKHEQALTLARSFAEDVGHMVIYSIEDPQDRQSMRTFYDAALVIGFNQGSFAWYVKDLSTDMQIKYLVARDRQQQFTDLVQPAIDQGLNSYNLSAPLWVVTGSRQDAEGTTGYLARTAADFSDTYHENYEQSLQARDWASFFNDSAELLSLANIPISRALIVYTRGQMLLLDSYSISFNILPPLNCSLNMAEAVGSQSFQPNIQSLPDCKLTVVSSTKLNSVLLSSSGEIDGEAWAAFRTEYSVALKEYADQARWIQDQLNDGETISKQDKKDLEETLARLRSLMAQGSALLTPADGQVWDDTTLSAFQGMMKIKAQTAMLLYIMDIPEASLKDAQMKEAVTQTFTALQSDIVQSQSDLKAVVFTGPSMGIPLVETVDDPIYASQGEMLKIQVRIKNIGSAPLSAGEVMAYPTGSESRKAMPVQSLEAGQEQILSLQVESVTKLPSQIEVTYKAGDQTMTRRVLMVEENLAESLGGERWFLIVGGLIMLLGGFAVISGFVLLRRKKKARG